MTAREKVWAVYPDALWHRPMDENAGAIFRNGNEKYGTQHLSGWLTSEDEAWEDAASRLPAPPVAVPAAEAPERLRFLAWWMRGVEESEQEPTSEEEGFAWAAWQAALASPAPQPEPVLPELSVAYEANDVGYYAKADVDTLVAELRRQLAEAQRTIVALRGDPNADWKMPEILRLRKELDEERDRVRECYAVIAEMRVRQLPGLTYDPATGIISGTLRGNK